MSSELKFKLFFTFTNHILSYFQIADANVVAGSGKSIVIRNDIIMIAVNVDVVVATLKIVQFVFLQGKNGMIVPVLVLVHVQLGGNALQDILLIMLTLVIAYQLT